jgi:hypothetical protein
MRLLLVLSSAVAFACGSSNGQITAHITDAPPSDANVKNVFITYDELRVHDDASSATADAGPSASQDGVDGQGWIILCSDTRTIDLMAVTNGVFAPVCATALADGGTAVLPVSVPAGNISQLRLHVTAARLTFNDGSPDQNLTIPSGGTSGLKINVNKSVPSGGTLDLKIDFDANASLTKLGSGQWQMHPVLSVL